MCPRTRQRCPHGETKLPIGERLPHGTIPLTAITVIVVSIGLALVGQVLFSARRTLRATTLHSAWTWAVIAFVAWAVSWVSDLGLRVASKSLADHLWYGSAVLALCPAIAVLGSRRPGARVWTWFIQVPLLLVLGWPVLSLWLQGSELRGLQLETPQLVAYVLVLVMGTGNYCGTRFTLPVLCFAAACACLAVSSSAACPAWLADRAWSRTWGTGLLVAAALLASRARGSRTHVIPHAVSGETSERGGVSPPVLGRKPSLEDPGGLRRPARKPLTLCRVRDMDRFDQLWLDFFDTFGVVWGRRIQDRVNFIAEKERWPTRLELQGFIWTGTSEEPSLQALTDEVGAITDPARAVAEARIEHTFRWLLRRFVDPPWIDERLGTAPTTAAVGSLPADS